jgi:hypothetical protein
MSLSFAVRERQLAERVGTLKVVHERGRRLFSGNRHAIVREYGDRGRPLPDRRDGFLQKNLGKTVN